MTKRRRILAAGAVALGLVGALATARPALGQQGDPAIATRLLATRAALEGQLAELASRGLTGSAAATAIQTRLAAGDFRQGDRVVLHVEGEAQLSDTFVVGAASELRLPAIGTISLAGVLRSEVEGYLAGEISRYLREPAVQARALVGASVSGEVARPGFHHVPADALLADLLAISGGATQRAKFDQIRMERRGERILDATEVERALAAGETLDDVGFQPGDQLVLPGASGTSSFTIVRTVSILLSVPLTIYSLTQIF